ncbi:MAG: cellulase family glycosylhydrolase [Melioribacteraceae bacterium]|nr:cellulase family glycosylhydrolase [Melioribacteraceae bacterium]
MKNSMLIILFFSLIIVNAKSDSFAQIKYPNPGPAGVLPVALADSIAPDNYGMRDLNSFEISREMIPGWNVGNSLEAIGGETNWGNPKITQRLIDSVKAAGFNTIRIPVAWSKFSDESTFTIEYDWMIRVEEVVNYVLINDMYAIINIHWDGGWMQPTYDQQEYVNNRLAAMWEQIAVFFRDYDDHLLFAGTNEVMVEGDYGTPKKEYYTVQNGYNQTFVNTVRSTGGCNYYRHLIVQGFNTNINYTYSYFVMPQDVVEGKLMLEVHYYDPYNFTLNTSSNITQWGMYATDPQRTETWANESYADAQFQKMRTKFIDKGIGVLLGEYGVISRISMGSDELNREFAGYRKYYMEYITTSLVNHGLVPVVWDNGYLGDYGFGLFNRSTGEKVYTDIINALVNAEDTTNITDVGINREYINPSEYSLGQNYPNPFNPSTKIVYLLGNSGFTRITVFDALGRKIKTLVEDVMPTGKHIVELNGDGLVSGVYYCRMTVNDFMQTRKLLILK